MSRPQKPLRIRLRKDNQNYEVVGYHPLTGKRVRIQTGSSDELKAKAFLAQFLAGIDASNGIPKMHDPLLTDLLDAYQRDKENNVTSKGTLRQNLNHLRRHLGGVKPWQVSDKTLERYRDLRREDEYTIQNTQITKKGVADSTIRRELSSLSQALKWAKRQTEDNWFVQKGYHDDFRYPVPNTTTRRHAWLTKKQAKLIAEHAMPHCQLFMMLALASAARHKAILELKWDMVDLEHGEIDFGPAVGNKDRPVTKVSKKLLKRLKEAHETACTDHVIEYGGKSISSIDTAYERAVIRAGFVAGHNSKGEPKPKYSVHVLKHTSITWMVQAQISYEEIAQITNTSKDVIQKHYGHHDPKLSAKAQKATAI